MNNYKKQSIFLQSLKKLYVEKILSKEQEKEYFLLFQKLDLNNDGQIGKNELTLALQTNELQLWDNEVNVLLEEFRNNNN